MPILLMLGIACLLPLGLAVAQEAGDEGAAPLSSGEDIATEAAAEQAVVESAPRPIRRHGDLVSVFSGDIYIPAHVEQWGTVVSVGGDVVVEGKVRGEVVVIMGSLELSGKVRGSAIGVLTNMTVHNAEVTDQLINIAGTLDKVKTYVGGQFVNIGFGDGWMTLTKPFGVLGGLLFWVRLVKVLGAFVLILLLAALVPDRIRVIADATPTKLVPAFFMGLLGYLGLWVVCALLLVTIIGVPLAIFVFIVLKWLGITGMFYYLGARVGRSLGREMSLLGAVILGFLPYVLLVLLPSLFGVVGLLIAMMIHTMIWLFLEVPAVGLALLTRAGSPAAARPVVPPKEEIPVAESEIIEPEPPLVPEPPPSEPEQKPE
jgi:hypothetical protein